MNISQYKDGFRYTSDTMFLWDFALGFIKKGSALEVGGGSGVLGLLLARDREIELSIVEKEPKMAYLCSLNANNNNIKAKIHNIDFANFEPMQNEKFDYIVSNPPFYHEERPKSQNDSLIASRYADSLSLELFLTKSKKLLKPSGELIFCYDASRLQDISTIANKLKGGALTHIRFVHAKADKKAKIALFRLKNSSRAHLEISPPLIVMQNGSYSLEAAEIFKKASCNSFDIK